MVEFISTRLLFSHKYKQQYKTLLEQNHPILVTELES